MRDVPAKLKMPTHSTSLRWQVQVSDALVFFLVFSSPPSCAFLVERFRNRRWQLVDAVPFAYAMDLHFVHALIDVALNRHARALCGCTPYFSELAKQVSYPLAKYVMPGLRTSAFRRFSFTHFFIASACYFFYFRRPPFFIGGCDAFPSRISSTCIKLGHWQASSCVSKQKRSLRQTRSAYRGEFPPQHNQKVDRVVDDSGALELAQNLLKASTIQWIVWVRYPVDA